MKRNMSSKKMLKNVKSQSITYFYGCYSLNNTFYSLIQNQREVSLTITRDRMLLRDKNRRYIIFI